MSELVTKEFLKAFGDKCKKIFKYQTKVATVSLYDLYYYAVIKTDLPFGHEWSIHMDINGKGLDINNPNTGELEYSGDIKFFCNISNKYPPTGRGYSLVDNEVLGVGISSYDASSSGSNQHNQCFIVYFSRPIHLIAVDIFNYEGEFSTINITDILFVTSVDDLVYNDVLGNIPNMVNDSIGEIIRLLELEELKEFSIELPSMDDSSIQGYTMRVPSETKDIKKVNSSKWSDYLKNLYNIILLEGDLKLYEITFGGDNKTEVTIPPLEINNSVLGNTEGEWFGKVLVNSKGLVTAVEPEEPLQVATETVLGGIQIGYEENTIEKNYPVSIDENNKAYVHVPWNDTDTWNKVANSDDLGLIKIGYTENGKNYPVELDSNNKAFVNVPWKEYEAATLDSLGLIKVGYESNGSNYKVLLDENNNAYVLVYNSKVTITNDDQEDLADILLYNTLYSYIDITPWSSSGYTLHVCAVCGKDASFKGCKQFIVRFTNTYNTSIPFYVSYSQKGGCTFSVDKPKDIMDMFSLQRIPLGEQKLICNVPEEGVLELVFTFWGANDISFNGGLNV